MRRLLREHPDLHVVNIDLLTYAGRPENVADVADDPRYTFVHGDISNADDVARAADGVDGIINVAAESHVDRSIMGGDEFITTNVLGTKRLLDHARAHELRYLQVSTDEVYGDVDAPHRSVEGDPLHGSSPYAASKAAGDLMVMAYARTYGLNASITRGSNTYGPYQFPEKLIPLMLVRAMTGDSLPVYGKGDNVRDWLHVEDHAGALLALLQRGRPGEKYNVGGGNERRNLDVVQVLCGVLDELAPDPQGPHARRIAFVADRPGHDLRYSIDTTKIRRELGWAPRQAFELGLRATVAWYLANRAWWEPVLRQKYDGRRLGLGVAG